MLLTYYKTQWHYKKFILMSHWYICICIVNCTVNTAKGDTHTHTCFSFLDIMALKGFHVEKVTVFWGWTASLVDTFIRLGVFLPRISYWKNKNKKQKKVLDAFHCFCTKMLPWHVFPSFCIFKMHISFCQRTSAFYSWSSILFILSDLYLFRYLVNTPPLF